MPANVIPRSRASAQGARHLEWRQTINGSAADLRFLLDVESPGAEPPAPAIEVVVVDSEGRDCHRVPVHLASRVRGAQGTELWGSAEAGRLSVRLAVAPGGGLTLQLKVTDQPAGARETLRLLDIIEALVPPNGVAVIPAGTTASRPTPLTDRLVPETPAGLRRLLEDLSAIEAALGARIVVPDVFTSSDRQDITATAALLRGEEVRTSWNELRWPMSAAEADELRAGVFAEDGQAQLEVETEWQLDVGEGSWPVGVVRMIHESARVLRSEPADVAGPDSTVVVTMVPGSSAVVRYRLVSAHPLDADDGTDQRWFWSESWQSRERAVDQAVAAGQVTTFASGEDFLAHLDQLDATGS